jgi:hypothetical protein
VIELADDWVRPDNLTIILSVWGDYKPKDELRAKYPLAYFLDKKETFEIPADAHVCTGGCDKCKKCLGLKAGQSVVFHEH